MKELKETAAAAGTAPAVYPDKHFLCSREEFAEWALGRKQLVLEHFYRMLRKRENVLMSGDDPVGGAWNFDRDNRESFKSDPGKIRRPLTISPDETTREVL